MIRSASCTQRHGRTPAVDRCDEVVRGSNETSDHVMQLHAHFMTTHPLPRTGGTLYLLVRSRSLSPPSEPSDRIIPLSSSCPGSQEVKTRRSVQDVGV